MLQTMTNRLIRMQEDLRASLKQPIEKRSWAMVIDVDKCIGCHACEISCKAENALPPGVSYRTVAETEDGEYPEVKRYFMPTNCQQCDNPPCIKGLDKESFTKRADGILVFHYDKLKGKKAFQQVKSRCPYTAVYHDTGSYFTEATPKLQPYETRVSYDYGQQWQRSSGSGAPIDAVRKCHFCLHRLEAGMLPSCVTTCVGGAMYFGDKNNSGSLITELLQRRQKVRIMEDEGTNPRVYYLTGTISTVATCADCHG